MRVGAWDRYADGQRVLLVREVHAPVTSADDVEAAPAAYRRRRNCGNASSGRVAAELYVLLAAALWWLLLSGRPGGGARGALIALSAAAMGTQSGMAARLRVPRVTTTRITGTWTGLSMSVGGTRQVRAGRTVMTEPGTRRVLLGLR